MFNCNWDSVILTHSCIVTVAPDITFAGAPNARLPIEGTLSFTCGYEAVPLPTMVQWFINDTILLDPKINNRLTVETNAAWSRLTLSRLQLNDAGSYSCKVTNSIGSDIRALTTVSISRTLFFCFVE